MLATFTTVIPFELTACLSAGGELVERWFEREREIEAVEMRERYS